MRVVKASEPDFERLWKPVFLGSEFQHPLYQRINIDFYHALADRRAATDFEDRSFVVENGDVPFVAVKMYLENRPGGHSELSCFGGIPLLYLERGTAGLKEQRKARQDVRAEIDRIIEKDTITRIWYEDFFLGGELSYLGKILLDMEARPTAIFRQVVDLCRDKTELLRDVRKSYRSLINWGKKNIDIKVWMGESFPLEEMERFRKLHIHVAGRETRCRETWDLQWEMVRCNEAMVIFGELNGDLVTAALFPMSPRYCFYGVSASMRELFDKPLSHIVIWQAMLAAKERGCRYFELGQILFPNLGCPPPTQKELGISTFKHGFGGRTNARLNIVWER